MTSEAGGGIGGRLQSYAGLDGDIYLRGGGGPEATGVLNTGALYSGPWEWCCLESRASTGTVGCVCVCVTPCR